MKVIYNPIYGDHNYWISATHFNMLAKYKYTYCIVNGLCFYYSSMDIK